MLGAALLAGGTALVNGIIGGFNNRRANHAQSVENAKQREWQTAENEKTREYNRMLAHQQNQWNIEQWNRENAYNSPAAQMKRFAVAGLNPNAVLGNMSNGPQISGSLTAGAPATPTQGQFDSSIGHRMSSQFDRVKLDPFMLEQLRGMSLDNDLKEQRLGREKQDNDFMSFLRYYDPDDPGHQMLSPKWTEYRHSVEGRRVIEEFDSLWYKNQRESLNQGAYEVEAEARKIDALIERDLKQQIFAVARNMDISTEDLETVVKAMFYSARGIKSDALLKEAEVIMSDPSFMEKLPQGLPALARFLRMLLK